MPATGAADAEPSWTLLTNHGLVLVGVARDPDARVADLAARVGITPRGVLSVLRDLEDGGYVVRTRRGRRTHYEVPEHRHFRHPSVAEHEVDGLLALLAGPRAGS